MQRVREAWQGKQRHRAVCIRSHRRACDKAGNSAQTCQLRSSPLCTSPHWLPHCTCSIFQHWWDKQQGFFSPFALPFAYQLISFAGHNINFLRPEPSAASRLTSTDSLWTVGNQLPGKNRNTISGWISISPGKRNHTKSLLNEETVWVRTSFTKINKWNAAVAGWAVANKHPQKLCLKSVSVSWLQCKTL